MYDPFATNWYVGEMRKMLLFPRPADLPTTSPPLTSGPANGLFGSCAAGPLVGSTIDTDGSSKNSCHLFVENANRACHRLARRLVALSSRPRKRWWYPGRFVS